MHPNKLLAAAAVISIVQSAPELTFKRYTSSVTKLVQKILDHHFPKCDLILIQDEHFASNMNGWVSTLKYPYYSVTLDGKPFPDYSTWQKITKTTGFLCSNVVATCLTYESCRIPDSVVLYKMMDANGVLLKERRSLLYVEKGPYGNGTTPYLKSYQQQNADNYTIRCMNEAKKILNELNTHITFIHEVRSAKLQARKKTDTIYETLTFTPNWFPGGTPVLKSIWSVKKGFIVPPNFMLDLSLARPGGTATFCVSSKHILPSFDISAGGEIDGLDGELIKIFQRRFGFRLEFIEPPDKEFGSKLPNGEWSGVIGSLMRKEADFGLGQITFTSERFETGLKFSQAVLVLQAVAICPTPKLLPRYEILMYPFQTSTWLCILLVAVVCMVSIEVMQRVACRLFGLKITVDNKTFFIKLRRQRRLPWIQSLGPLFVRSISVQGLPKRWGVLALFSTWLLFTFIVNVYYTTILIGALAIFPREAYIRSPLELLRSQHTWAVSPIVNQTLTNSSYGSETLLLQGATTMPDDEFTDGPLDAKIYSYINSTGNCGLAESTRSRYYLSQSFTVKVGNHEYTKVYVSKESLFIGPTGWAFRPDVDFLLETYLDNLFLELRSFGFIVKASSSWQKKEHRVRDSGFQPLSMTTIEPVFQITGCCIIITLVVFVVEMISQPPKRLLNLPKYV